MSDPPFPRLPIPSFSSQRRATDWSNQVAARLQARVRPRGHRKYRLVGKPSRSFLVALKALTNTFGKSNYYKRGDVICTADYYDPIVCCEIVRP